MCRKRTSRNVYFTYETIDGERNDVRIEGNLMSILSRLADTLYPARTNELQSYDRGHRPGMT